MINTVVFFGVALLLLISLLAEECEVVPWRPVCSSPPFPAAPVWFSPGNWASTGLHWVLPKRFWHRKLNMSRDILEHNNTFKCVCWVKAKSWTSAQCSAEDCRQGFSTFFYLTAPAHCHGVSSFTGCFSRLTDIQVPQYHRNPMPQDKYKMLLANPCHLPSETLLIILLSNLGLYSVNISCWE